MIHNDKSTSAWRSQYYYINCVCRKEEVVRVFAISFKFNHAQVKVLCRRMASHQSTDILLANQDPMS